jgi:hypothetical protein
VRSINSNFKLLTSKWLAGWIPLAAQGQSTNDTPQLQPVLPEIPPTLWEQHGWLMIALGVVLFVAFALLLWWMLKPNLPIVVPIEIQTQRELEALRQLAEDGTTLGEITRCLRRYFTVAFELSPGELTTREFNKVILTNPRIGPKLSSECAEFLSRCDRRKFSPENLPVASNAAARAMELFQLGETRRVELRQVARPK